jgi:1-deoxy-D-xylulose-5-phosphate synthase
LLREGDDIAILAYGAPVSAALDAAERLADSGIQAAVVNARFAKPLDEALILDVCRRARSVITLEEHVLAGGFSAAVLELLNAHNLAGLPIITRTMPDTPVEHGPQSHFRAAYGLDADGIIAAARTLTDPTPVRRLVQS